jgi:hypothetical protein
MNAWRRIFGIDPANSILVVAGSFAVVIFTGELTGSGEMAVGAMALCIGGYGILRHYALKALPPEEESSGAWRAADLEARVADLELMDQRVAELEERLDFAERLLASKNEPVRLEGPK